jgi:hypothetical protein
MQFSQLYSSALSQELGTDDSTRLFTDARRKDAINFGALHFCDLTECAIRQSTISCSHAVGEYNLLSPTNIASLDYLRLAKQGPEFHKISSGVSPSTTFIAGDDFVRREIPWLNQYSPGWRASTGGTPEAYYERMDGGQRLFGLVPPPALGSSQIGKVILPYVAKPQTMSASTDLPFTFGSTVRTDLEPYHQAVVHFGAAQLEKLRRDWDAVQTQTQLALGYVQRFLQTMQPKGGMQVRFGRNYFGEIRQRGTDDEIPIPYPWRT